MGIQMADLLKSMPKVELHAHLNGSISDNLLEHISNFTKNFATPEEIPCIDANGVLMDRRDNASTFRGNNDLPMERNLQECWKKFGKIHEVIRTPAAVYVATVNVIAEFSQDNVIYLEMRTGPKKIHSILSKMSYVEAVVKGIEDGQKRFPIIVKLLISVDRKNGEEEGREVVNLAATAAKKYPNLIVGIDISGDPNYGRADWIVRVMSDARSKGLKIVNPEEAMMFLQFGPERVGHGQFLNPRYGGNTDLWRTAKQKQIPIETCISSNLISGVTASLDTHVVKLFQEESLPYVICTDDSGVFGTSLTMEFGKLLSVVNLGLPQIQGLCLQAASYAFANDDVKDALRSKINSWWAKCKCSESLSQNA